MFKRNPQCIIHLSTETSTPPIAIYEKKFLIGRKATHLVSIPDNSISRDHVEVIIKDDEVYIKDLGTANGTKIDGYLITPQIPVPCREGQILTLGLCSIGIVIEIFSKDKKKSKPNLAYGKQQQPDSQNNSYKPVFNSTAAPVFEYSNPEEVQNSHLDQPESPKYAEPAYQEPKLEQSFDPVYEEPKLEQSYEPVYKEPKLEQSFVPNHQEVNSSQEVKLEPSFKSNTHQPESLYPIYGNSEQEIMNNAKDEASRIIARAKVEIETNGREFLRSKELEAQNIINQAQQKSLEKIHETEKHTEELLKKANNQAQELVTNAQSKSQELLTQAQNETQILYKKNEEEVLKLKELTIEDGRKEKQNIVAGAYLERESILKETEQLKLNIPELNSRIDVIKTEITDFITQKNIAEAEYTAQTKKVEAAAAQVKIHEDQVAQLQNDFQQVQKKIELAEEKHKATLLDTQTLVQETHDTLARVTRRENELNGLIDGAKLQKEDAEKYSFAVKQDADKYSLNLKQDADKYANATKQDADKYSTTTKQDADKYTSAAKQDADKYTINLKQDADKYSTATKQDADKYATTIKQAADKYTTTTKQDADKHAQITKDETEAEIKRRLEFLQKETETIFANRDREFHDLKTKQENILQELKTTEEERTKSLFSIDSQLANKQKLMDQELSVKLAEQNAALNAQKELLEKEYSTLKTQRETEFKNIRVQQDTFLNELRKSEEDKIRHMLEESQKMIHSQRNTKITHVQESLDNFFNELQKSATGEITDQLPLLRDNLKRLMTETLTNEYAGEESQLKKILDYNPEIANQHKKFWKKAAIASAFAVSALGASIYYHSLIQQIPQQMQTSMEETDRENKLATQQHLEAVRQAGIYRPAQDLNFKFNYTDNVIFTKNYMDFEYHEAIHKEWTIKLNKFLLDTAGISDDQAIQFMASESSLVRNLESKKALIDGKNPESGIKNMRLLEDEYQIIIQSTLKAHKDEFWALKKELYLKFIQENSQRIPAEEKN